MKNEKSKEIELFSAKHKRKERGRFSGEKKKLNEEEREYVEHKKRVMMFAHAQLIVAHPLIVFGDNTLNLPF